VKRLFLALIVLSALAIPARADPTIEPPVISIAFSFPNIPINGVDILTVTVTNPNASTDLNGIAFFDSFPVNLFVETPNGLVDNCGGTASAIQGTGSVSLVGGGPLTPAGGAGASCTVSVNVTSAFAGTYTDSAGPVSSTNGGTGNSATASFVVGPVPEPGTIFLLGTGLLGVMAMTWYRKRFA